MCFETLLQYSLLHQEDFVNMSPTTTVKNNKQKNNVAENNITSKLAVTSLLHRFQEVLKKYVEDEKLHGKCPLPRHRMAEISFVLKAISTLISSLKIAPPDKGNVDHSQIAKKSKTYII